MSRRPINVYTPLSHSTTIFILWRFLTPSGNFVITPASHGRHFEAIIRDHFHKRVHPYIELPPHIWFIFTLICSTLTTLAGYASIGASGGCGVLLGSGSSTYFVLDILPLKPPNDQLATCCERGECLPASALWRFSVVVCHCTSVSAKLRYMLACFSSSLLTCTCTAMVGCFLFLCSTCELHVPSAMTHHSCQACSCARNASAFMCTF